MFVRYNRQVSHRLHVFIVDLQIILHVPFIGISVTYLCRDFFNLSTDLQLPNWRVNNISRQPCFLNSWNYWKNNNLIGGHGTNTVVNVFPSKLKSIYVSLHVSPSKLEINLCVFRKYLLRYAKIVFMLLYKAVLKIVRSKWKFKWLDNIFETFSNINFL